MKQFTVSVEKRMYATGTIKIQAPNPDEAIKKVYDLILKGKLQTTEIQWGDPEYEDDSFKPTGDVD